MGGAEGAAPARGEAVGDGATLSGTAIEAAAMSFVTTNESGKSGGGGGPEQNPSIAPSPADSGSEPHAATGGHASKASGGVDGASAMGDGGADVSGSVGDVVVVGGVALGNHRGFPGDDWSQSQPGTPSSAQVV